MSAANNNEGNTLLKTLSIQNKYLMRTSLDRSMKNMTNAKFWKPISTVNLSC